MVIIADPRKAPDTAILKNKSVLITGGASGIGALVATQFARHGSFVTIADINAKQGEKFTQDLRKSGAQIHFIETDVSNWQSQVRAFKIAIRNSDSNSIDIVIAAAGVGGFEFVTADDEEPSLEHDPFEPLRSAVVFDVNAKGAYYSTKLAQHYFALPKLVSSQTDQAYRKAVILVSSLAGYLEIHSADYSSSKWAVRGLFRASRSKMEDLGHRVNLIAPWVMDTPMSHSLADVCRKNGIPVGDADDVANAIILCAADESISGE